MGNFSMSLQLISQPFQLVLPALSGYGLHLLQRLTGHFVVRVEIKKLSLVMRFENRFHSVPFLLPTCCLTLAYDFVKNELEINSFADSASEGQTVVMVL